MATKTKPVTIQWEDWCKLCDTLKVSPDSDIQTILQVAKIHK